MTINDSFTKNSRDKIKLFTLGTSDVGLMQWPGGQQLMRKTWQQQLVQAYFYFYQVCLIFHFVFVPDSCLPALVETAKKKKNSNQNESKTKTRRSVGIFKQNARVKNRTY